MAGRKARHGGCSQAPRRQENEIAVTLDDIAREDAGRMVTATLEAQVDK
jgi:hypothetical protein